VLSFGPFSALFFLFHERVRSSIGERRVRVVHSVLIATGPPSQFKKMLLDRVPKDSTFANSAFGVAATRFALIAECATCSYCVHSPSLCCCLCTVVRQLVG